ncbi:hypothetical protein [Hyphomonas sp.]|uniref:hypothetical protein n=1 Tax=Hyphomonas sp. TaxID=87 RepID=UPI0025C666B5|nr:hypothetical protein [Hyphomonas sp.]
MTDANTSAPVADDRRFIRNLATGMAIILVAGFVVQAALGRSSFNAPLIVHAHAVVFMGWVGIVLTQVWLAGAGNIPLHRQVGKLAAIWALGLLIFGTWITVAAVQTGRTPFFFQPQHFIVANPMTLCAAIGLLVAAYVMRKQTDWHARLQIASFVLLMGPGFGRLLPMPFLPPYAFEIASLTALIFPAIGILYDWRVHGRPHPAWFWTIGVLIAVTLVARIIGFSPVGEAVYDAVVAGTPLAGTSGLDFPPPPGPPPAPM